MGAKKTRADLVGKQFGQLTVIEYSHTNKHGKSMWKCLCECGNERIVAGIHLKSGHTRSCGCVKNELSGSRLRTHGKSKTRLHRIWINMKSRCYIKNTPSFEIYGARGITVCDEWLNSFQAFHDWATANGYSDDLSIDRIDNDGNYEPSNCRWAAQKVQCNNKNTNVFITFKGSKHTLKEWSEITGIKYGTLCSRYKAGRTPDEILYCGKLV